VHERSLMSALLRQVEAICREQAADKIVSLKLKVGEFSGVEIDLLETAFRDLAVGTPAEEAKLAIESVALKVQCDRCGGQSLVERFRFQCRACQSNQVRIVEGEEMVLESVTLEGTDP